MKVFFNLINCFCSCKKHVNCLIITVKANFLSLGKLFYLHANTVNSKYCVTLTDPAGACRRKTARWQATAATTTDRSMLNCMSPMFCDCYVEVSLLTTNDWNTTLRFLAVTRKRRIFCCVTLSLVLKHVALQCVPVQGAETSLRPKKSKTT